MRVFIIFVFFTLVACDNAGSSSSEKYFSNCVYDYIKHNKLSKNKKDLLGANKRCQTFVNYSRKMDTYKFFEGKIWSNGVHK